MTISLLGVGSGLTSVGNPALVVLLDGADDLVFVLDAPGECVLIRADLSPSAAATSMTISLAAKYTTEEDAGAVRTLHVP
ncbi:hypothetical protein [Neorhizobium sp. T25_13]|uniref:hypothetical protein n=1 Tax=Neorhizobium sp. T25_13 TaxID=2093830 RepID=UPI000CF872BC|nr:hypothetical protein [Neorhizobium sp. T25_13]